MTAGVPGAGIAGLFYLAGALLTPLFESVRALRSGAGPRNWRGVARLAGIAATMLAGICLTSLLVGLVLTRPAVLQQVPGVPVGSAGAAPQFIARAAVFLTFGTLAAVLVAVELLRLLFSPRRTAARRSLAARHAHVASPPE